jgi:hypothetical protein
MVTYGITKVTDLKIQATESRIIHPSAVTMGFTTYKLNVQQTM